MNNKCVINAHLSTIESKNKLSKQEEQKQNHGYGELLREWEVLGGGEQRRKNWDNCNDKI